MIPWKSIGSASIKEKPEGKAQVASVILKDGQKKEIGGVCNVFPKLTDVERFVGQVNSRLQAVTDEAD